MYVEYLSTFIFGILVAIYLDYLRNFPIITKITEDVIIPKIMVLAGMMMESPGSDTLMAAALRNMMGFDSKSTPATVVNYESFAIITTSEGIYLSTCSCSDYLHLEFFFDGIEVTIANPEFLKGKTPEDFDLNVVTVKNTDTNENRVFSDDAEIQF